jgi:hypothetical protein
MNAIPYLYFFSADQVHAVSVSIHIGEGVDELLESIGREADLIVQHLVMRWPCCPLEIARAHRLN